MFLFVEQDLEGTPMVRRGEVIASDSDEVEVLFNEAARLEIQMIFQDKLESNFLKVVERLLNQPTFRNLCI
jgi:hypothetical protein